jgi:hypothetical protein
MSWKKNVLIYALWALLFLGLITVVMMERQPPPQNIFSQQCSGGQYLVFGAEQVLCEEPRACTTDADCSYLLIDKLPTRVGSCVRGTCRAQCGSGMLRDCY